jgi:hypothetical protein
MNTIASSTLASRARPRRTSLHSRAHMVHRRVDTARDGRTGERPRTSPPSSSALTGRVSRLAVLLISLSCDAGQAPPSPSKSDDRTAESRPATLYQRRRPVQLARPVVLKAGEGTWTSDGNEIQTNGAPEPLDRVGARFEAVLLMRPAETPLARTRVAFLHAADEEARIDILLDGERLCAGLRVGTIPGRCSFAVDKVVSRLAETRPKRVEVIGATEKENVLEPTPVRLTVELRSGRGYRLSELALRDAADKVPLGLRTLAAVDFSTGAPLGSIAVTLDALRGSVLTDECVKMRLSTVLRGDFELAGPPAAACLVIDYLSSHNAAAPRKGSSPLEVTMNGVVLCEEIDPGAMGYVRDDLDVSGLLREGANEVRLRATRGTSDARVRLIAVTSR